ncbi:MAG: sodium/proline symporter [Candidatus Bipolaricaulia bacterium]
MSSTAIYIGVLSAYMLALGVIGIVATKRTRTADDYHLGGRSVGAWVTALSYVAAYFSSVVIIGGGGFGYRYGMATLWIGAINVLVGCALAWIVLGRRIRQFTERLRTTSVPGFLAERFRAPEARVLVSIVIALFLVIYNVSVLKGMGNAFEVLMGIPYAAGVLLSGAILILYVAFGGYLAVVWTGFIQAWIMGAGLILLTVSALKAVGGLAAANVALAAIDPGLVRTPGVWGWAGLVSYAMIVSFGVWGMPQMVVRFYSVKSVSVLRVGTVLATIGGSMAVLPYLNGAIARVLYPGLATPDHAIPVLAKAVLSPWGGALLLAGVIAAGMSTFAAVLIITSTAVVRDFVGGGLGRKLTSGAELRWSRVVSVVVGLLSLGIALKPPDLVLVLTAFSWAVIASTCLWPMLFGLYWKRATRWGALASMVCGLVTALVWMALGSPYGLHGFIPGLGVGLVAMVVVSLLTERLPEEHLDRVWGVERQTPSRRRV